MGSAGPDDVCSPRSSARHDGTFSHDHGALDAIFHLPDIARPGMAFDGSEGILTEAERGALFLCAKFILEVMRKQRRIAHPLPQGRNGNHDFA